MVDQENKIHACVRMWKEIAERNNEAIHKYGIDSTVAKSLQAQYRKSDFIKFDKSAGVFEIREDSIKTFAENAE